MRRPFRSQSNARFSRFLRRANRCVIGAARRFQAETQIRLFLCHSSEPMTPVGNFGAGSSLRLAVSNRCKTLNPSSFVTKAIVLPSHERAKYSTSQLIEAVR